MEILLECLRDLNLMNCSSCCYEHSVKTWVRHHLFISAIQKNPVERQVFGCPLEFCCRRSKNSNKVDHLTLVENIECMFFANSPEASEGDLQLGRPHFKELKRAW